MLGRRPQRLSVYFLLVVVMAALVGTIYLWRGVATRTVYVAAVDLPALHQITQSDLRSVDMRTSEVPDRAMSERAILLGRYTLTAVAQDQPFARDALGPQLAPGAVAKRRLTGLGVSIADVQGLISRGDTVDVFVSAADRSDPGVIIREAVILDMRDAASEGKRTLLLAVNESDERNLLRISNEARILVVRTVAQSSF